MAVMMLHDLVGPNWVLHAGEVYDFDALREHHWIACGYCCEWTEDDQRIWEKNNPYVNIDFNVTQNGLSIDAER